jgi:hypothetical protein
MPWTKDFWATKNRTRTGRMTSTLAAMSWCQRVPPCWDWKALQAQGEGELLGALEVDQGAWKVVPDAHEGEQRGAGRVGHLAGRPADLQVLLPPQPTVYQPLQELARLAIAKMLGLCQATRDGQRAGEVIDVCLPSESIERATRSRAGSRRCAEAATAAPRGRTHAGG